MKQGTGGSTADPIDHNNHERPRERDHRFDCETRDTEEHSNGLADRAILDDILMEKSWRDLRERLANFAVQLIHNTSKKIAGSPTTYQFVYLESCIGLVQLCVEGAADKNDLEVLSKNAKRVRMVTRMMFVDGLRMRDEINNEECKALNSELRRLELRYFNQDF